VFPIPPMPTMATRSGIVLFLLAGIAGCGFAVGRALSSWEGSPRSEPRIGRATMAREREPGELDTKARRNHEGHEGVDGRAWESQ
jgi:hypothetical protein